MHLRGFFYFGAITTSQKKATMNFVMFCPFVRPSVHPSVRETPSFTGWIFTKFSISIYSENQQRKFKFHENLTTITATLDEDQYTFLIISRSILFRMRNVSDESCRENQNTHFVFSTFFEKKVPFMRYCGKILQRVQATDDNKTHTLSMLNNGGYKPTITICNTYYISTTTMIVRTRIIFTSYIHCLNCYIQR